MMHTMTRQRSTLSGWCLGTLLVALSAAGLAQTSKNQPSLQIASPAEGSLVSGKVVLRADLDPPAAASTSALPRR